MVEPSTEASFPTKMLVHASVSNRLTSVSPEKETAKAKHKSETIKNETQKICFTDFGLDKFLLLFTPKNIKYVTHNTNIKQVQSIKNPLIQDFGFTYILGIGNWLKINGEAIYNIQP